MLCLCREYYPLCSVVKNGSKMHFSLIRHHAIHPYSVWCASCRYLNRSASFRCLPSGVSRGCERGLCDQSGSLNDRGPRVRLLRRWGPLAAPRASGFNFQRVSLGPLILLGHRLSCGDPIEGGRGTQAIHLEIKPEMFRQRSLV